MLVTSKLHYYFQVRNCSCKTIFFYLIFQDYTCPYCDGGFIEQLEDAADTIALSSDDYSDADMSNIEDMSNIDDMSNLDDSDEVQRVRVNTMFHHIHIL